MFDSSIAAEAPTWADHHPVATALDGWAPGVALVETLAGIVVPDMDDAALVEAVAAWERITSWAAAEQAKVVSEMVRRASSGKAPEFVADEIAARMATSRRAADQKVDLAINLEHDPAVHDALGSGALDTHKTALLIRETAHLSLDDARTVRDAVLREAPGLTSPQLRTAIRRAELMIDLQAAERRHERAVTDRSVRMTPAPSSMAWLTAYLPAAGAMQVMTAVDAIAASAAPEDIRSIDQRRADALVDVMAGVLDSGVGPDGPLVTQQHRRPHLEVTASARSLLGLDDAPALLAGYGAIPAAMAQQIAADATWRPVLTDGRTGTFLARSSCTYRPAPALVDDVARRDQTCTFPGCRMKAVRCDIDHIEPFDWGRPPELQTRFENLQALCRHHHRMKSQGRWAVERDPRTGVTTWRSPTGHTYTRDPVPTDPGIPAPPWSGPPPDSAQNQGQATTAGRGDVSSTDSAQRASRTDGRAGEPPAFVDPQPVTDGSSEKGPPPF